MVDAAVIYRPVVAFCHSLRHARLEITVAEGSERRVEPQSTSMEECGDMSVDNAGYHVMHTGTMLVSNVAIF